MCIFKKSACVPCGSRPYCMQKSIYLVFTRQAYGEKAKEPQPFQACQFIHLLCGILGIVSFLGAKRTTIKSTTKIEKT